MAVWSLILNANFLVLVGEILLYNYSRKIYFNQRLFRWKLFLKFYNNIIYFFSWILIFRLIESLVVNTLMYIRRTSECLNWPYLWEFK